MITIVTDERSQKQTQNDYYCYNGTKVKALQLNVRLKKAKANSKCFCFLGVSSIRCRGTNPRPLDREPSALTTIPWLSNFKMFIFQLDVKWPYLYIRPEKLEKTSIFVFNLERDFEIVRTVNSFQPQVYLIAQLVWND